MEELLQASEKAREDYYQKCARVVVALEYGLPTETLVAEAKAGEAAWSQAHHALFAVPWFAEAAA